MDDAQGTTQAKPAERFELSFHSDGVATFKLGCHQGVAAYEARPATDDDSGSLAFIQFAAMQSDCAPWALDDRVKRDLPHVRSYLFKNGRLYLSLMADGGIQEWVSVPSSPPTTLNKERTVKPMALSAKAATTTVSGRLVGRQFVDHVVRGSAGQRLSIKLRSGNSSTYFVLMPPDSAGEAMASGEFIDNQFDGILPDDGAYTVRVFLYRAAARRGETSRYSLTLGLTGKPLMPRSTSLDATLTGTRFHASATTACQPSYSQARTCLARVVRREPQGSATVELIWGPGQRRRILFIAGEPKHADTSLPLSFTATDRGWHVTFGPDEHFDIPQELVHGG